MSRPKREFKLLCVLPMGEWKVIQHREGTILMVDKEHAAFSIDVNTGKVTKLLGAEHDASTQES